MAWIDAKEYELDRIFVASGSAGCSVAGLLSRKGLPGDVPGSRTISPVHDQPSRARSGRRSHWVPHEIGALIVIILVKTFEVFNDGSERAVDDTAAIMSNHAGRLGYRLVRSRWESKKYFNVASTAGGSGTSQMRERQELLSTLATTGSTLVTTIFEVLNEG